MPPGRERRCYRQAWVRLCMSFAKQRRRWSWRRRVMSKPKESGPGTKAEWKLLAEQVDATVSFWNRWGSSRVSTEVDCSSVIGAKRNAMC